MSYPHKDLVQYESRRILNNSRRIQVAPNMWVSKEIAIKDYGYVEPEPQHDASDECFEKISMLRALAIWFMNIFKFKK